MFNISDFLSFLYFISFLIYLLLATYLLVVDRKYRVNRMFALTLLSLSLWALAYSRSVNALTFENAVFWRRVGCIGWALMFAMYLNTIIIFTSPTTAKRNNFKRFMLYTPAMYSIYIFSFNSSTVDQFFNMKQTVFGWQNIGAPMLSVYLVYLYVVVYFIWACILIFLMYSETKLKRKKEHALKAGFSLIFTMVFGGIYDIIFPLVLNWPLPEIAVIICIIPMYITWQSIVQYRIMHISINTIANDIIENMNEGAIGIDENYKVVKISLNAQNILKISGNEAIGKNFTLLFNDNEINAKDYFGKTKSHETSVYIFAFTKNLKRTVAIDGGNIDLDISTAPVYDETNEFMGGCIIFHDVSEIVRKQADLISTYKTLESVVNQRTLELQLTNQKLIEEIELRIRRNEWDNLLFNASSTLITVNSRNIKNKINTLLENLGRYFDVDKCNINRIDPENSIIHIDYIWLNNKKLKYNLKTKPLLTTEFAWALDKMKSGILLISDVNEISDEAKAEREFLDSYNIKTSVSIPIMLGGQYNGYLKLDSIGRLKSWTDDEITMLVVFGNILSDGISKVGDGDAILKLAYYDNLTGLPNRISITETIDYLIGDINRIKNHGFNSFSILLFDIDLFKNINDSLGHDAGDTLIKLLSERLINEIGDRESISRFGGNSFLLLAPNFNNEVNYMLIETIYNLLKKPFNIKGQDIYVTISLGVSTYPDDGDTSEKMISSAFNAMYKAKEDGKNRYIISTDTLREDTARKLYLKGELVSAIQNNEMFLLYQPQIDLATKKIIGVEALLRWKHPKLGIVSPAVFIPIAESSGQILKIGEWVLQESIKQAKYWRDIGLAPITMAVNLSLAQFINESFVDEIVALLDKYSFDAHDLELEITESIAMDKNSTVLEALSAFKSHGIKISLDDFGTHYSSLSRIKEMPIDTLKIALEFVQSIERDHKNKELTEIIISIGKSLNLKLIAEGAETPEQVEYLSERNVEIVQGYHFYKPLKAKDVEELLKKQQKTDVQGI